MRKVTILGTGMTKFGKDLDSSLKTLSHEAITKCLSDANISKDKIEAAYVGNSVAGLITGQETIRGQVMLRESGIGGIPIFNTENACASSSTAFHLAWLGIASGMYECVLVTGVEKMTHEDRTKTFLAFESGLDVETITSSSKQSTHSIFMEVYAEKAKVYMEKYGVTKEHLARIAAKNHTNGSLNPYAQKNIPMTYEDVLNDEIIVTPFTKAMCSPISDGGAAIILCSENFARKHTTNLVYVSGSIVNSTSINQDSNVIEITSKKAYSQAGISPEELDVIEVHDATASAELIAYEQIGLCGIGEGKLLVEEGVTNIEGVKPVNPSGGLESKGHPIGATGLGQIIEITWQLQGRAGKHQINGKPRIGIAQNAGGHLGNENAACTITILER
jgi:acetyl-CoA acyltransferase